MFETVTGYTIVGVDDVEKTTCWSLINNFVDDACS